MGPNDLPPAAWAKWEEGMEQADANSSGGLVCGGGAAAVAVALDALFGGRKRAQAQELGVAVPEINRLAVRVVTDSFQIAVAPSFKRDNIEVERFGWALGDAPPDKAIVEFGLSLHAASVRGDETRATGLLTSASRRTRSTTISSCLASIRPCSTPWCSAMATTITSAEWRGSCVRPKAR